MVNSKRLSLALVGRRPAATVAATTTATLVAVRHEQGAECEGKQEMSIIAGQSRLWCSEMTKCVNDAVLDYAQRVESLVLSQSLS